MATLFYQKKSKIFSDNEPGLYEVLSISRKPLAKIFMNEYFTNIIVPSERIRLGHTVLNYAKNTRIWIVYNE